MKLCAARVPSPMSKAAVEPKVLALISGINTTPSSGVSLLTFVLKIQSPLTIHWIKPSAHISS